MILNRPEPEPLRNQGAGGEDSILCSKCRITDPKISGGKGALEPRAPLPAPIGCRGTSAGPALTELPLTSEPNQSHSSPLWLPRPPRAATAQALWLQLSAGQTGRPPQPGQCPGPPVACLVCGRFSRSIEAPGSPRLQGLSKSHWAEPLGTSALSSAHDWPSSPSPAPLQEHSRPPGP